MGGDRGIPPDELTLEALAAENARLRLALEAAERENAAMHRFLDTPAIAITQMARDGTILLINKAGARNMGGTPSQLEGKNMLELVPELADQTRRRIETTLDTAEPLPVESLVKLPGGERWFRSTYYPVLDKHGTPVSIQLVSQDITELKRVEQLLEATEGRLASVLEHAPHIICVLDLDGEVRYVNRTAMYDRASLIGASAATQVPPEHSEPFLRTFRSVIETREPRLLEVTDHFGRSWEIRLAPSMRDGKVHQVLAFGVEISERRQAEQRERQLEDQVHHSQKLESLGVLAGGIAHDFNNLLVGILGNAQLAHRSHGTGAVGEYLQSIIQSAQRAADLCRQMLAYAGRGRVTLGALDVSSLSLEILDLVRASVSKRARIVSDCPAGLPCVMGDASQLGQVVMNLLTNASDALGGGDGEIKLRTGLVECDGRYLASAYLNETLAPGAYVYIEVEDTGAGMDVETRRRMFDPFFTTKQLGSGLGLAAALGIVRRHRGAVHVESEVGRGTTIRVVLPVAQMREVQPAPVTTASGAPGRTILVVDDEPMVRAVAQSVFEEAGHRVLAAADGVEALEQYDAHADAIDAVLLDLNMPRMDGRQTLKQLRARDPRLPVVLASGFGASTDDHDWSADAATHFLAKPFDLETLLAALGFALSRSPRAS